MGHRSEPPGPERQAINTRRHADGLQSNITSPTPAPGLVVGTGDVLFVSVYLDPKDPPKGNHAPEWNTGEWNHRGFIGATIGCEFGADGTEQRKAMGPLPKTGEWIRLEVPAKDLKLKVGSEITGWAFTQFGGTVYWDKAGIVTRVPQGEQSFATFDGWLRRMQTVSVSGLPKPVQDAVKAGAKRTDCAEDVHCRGLLRRVCVFRNQGDV